MNKTLQVINSKLEVLDTIFLFQCQQAVVEGKQCSKRRREYLVSGIMEYTECEKPIKTLTTNSLLHFTL